MKRYSVALAPGSRGDLTELFVASRFGVRPPCHLPKGEVRQRIRCCCVVDHPDYMLCCAVTLGVFRGGGGGGGRKGMG